MQHASLLLDAVTRHSKELPTHCTSPRLGLWAVPLMGNRFRVCSRSLASVVLVVSLVLLTVHSAWKTLHPTCVWHRRKTCQKDYGFATMHVEYHQISVEYFNDEALQKQHPMSSRHHLLRYVTLILFLRHSRLDQGRRLWDPVVIPRIDVVQDILQKSCESVSSSLRGTFIEASLQTCQILVRPPFQESLLKKLREAGALFRKEPIAPPRPRDPRLWPGVPGRGGHCRPDNGHERADRKGQGSWSQPAAKLQRGAVLAK